MSHVKRGVSERNYALLLALTTAHPVPVWRDALYFILGQAPNKRASSPTPLRPTAAHTLTNGAVPLDRIRVKVANLLVKSLREMPEHHRLVTD